MPLHLNRSPANRTLWTAFLDAFLGALGDEPGPRFPAHAWLAHRTHRDMLLEAAEEGGIRGWVGAPFSFLTDLPERLGIAGRPAGLLTRRRLLGGLAAREASRAGIATGIGQGGGVARGHVLDGLFSELLPEGVAPDALRGALSAVESDDFARRRNAWVTDVYARYLEALDLRGLFDPRAVPALLARAIRDGGLPGATGGAPTLHLYGLHSLRTRGALIQALAAQDEVAVHTYLPPAEEGDEWEPLAASSERLGGERPIPEVQPVPDQEREMRWVAERVKRLLQDDGVAPHRVAVVARVGLEDTRRAHRALEDAGVPASARIRTPLAEIAALRFILELFRGAAADWPYPALRNVLSSPYIDCPVEPWFLDNLANERRIRGLGEWTAALAGLRDRLLGKEEPSAAQVALAERVERSREALERFAGEVRTLAGERTEAGWIALTLELMDPGILWFRRRLSREVRDRWDAVRLDQRGVVQLEALLREWGGLELADEPMDAGAWHVLLTRLMEGHSLTLSTPLQRGVQVLEAHDAALTPFDHVFLVHANDGEFPRLAGSGGIFTESERRSLRDRLPLGHRELDLARERALWRAVTAADRVSVSYRTTDPSGQPLLPSLLVEAHDVATELSRVWKLPETPLGPGEWLLVRAGALARGEEAGAAETDDDAREPYEAGAADADGLAGAVVNAVAEWQRETQGRARAGGQLEPSPWAGHLRDPVVLERLEGMYPPDHAWSAGRLEAYATCPFVFLLDRVLGLAPSEQADEETSALMFGGVAHEVLELFYRRLEPPLPDALDARASGLLDAVLREVRARRESGDEWLGLPVLWRQTIRQIGEAVRAYLEWELPLLAASGHRPFETEHGFGFEGPAVSIVGPDIFGELTTLPLHGRIDRVDREGAGEGAGEGADEGGDAVYHVVDYKSGGVPAASGYHDGSTLQAALYLSAWAREKDVRGGISGYRSIKRPTGKGSQRAVKWDDAKHRAALAIAFSIPRRIRAGHFEPMRAAASSSWAPWDPGIEIVRGRGAFREGSRFDAPLAPAEVDRG